MTDEELTYAKEAKRKRGANVVEQEFAQPKHRKDPPRNNKKTNQPAQPASKEQVEGSHLLLLQPPCGEENLPRKDQSAKRNKGEETPPTSTSVENKTRQRSLKVKSEVLRTRTHQVIQECLSAIPQEAE